MNFTLFSLLLSLLSRRTGIISPPRPPPLLRVFTPAGRMCVQGLIKVSCDPFSPALLDEAMMDVTFADSRVSSHQFVYKQF